jgi:phosphoribosylamine--glycine ligase
MNVLVVGSGGREHALVWKLKQSSKIEKIYCAPGNGGIGRIAENVDIKADDVNALAEFAERNDIGLTMVGPEVPLSLGIVDEFEKRGLAIFGPNAEAARLESSKIFSKEFMASHHIPTADFIICKSAEAAKMTVQSSHLGFPLVLKADGLAAGKGVLICDDQQEALDGVEQLMVNKAFGDAGDRILVERCLVGTEVSYMIIADGEDYIPLVPSADYKRALDGDQGLNTGGMGAYAPSVLVDEKLRKRIESEVVKPVLAGLKKDGMHFRGLLYIGLMITEDGPQVLEFNVRFGDPETQVILPLLETDLVDLFEAAIQGRLADMDATWKGAATTIVMAAEGYPDSYKKGMSISGLEQFDQSKDVVVFHAGTKEENGGIISSGGRVLNVTAIADDLPGAVDKAYAAVKAIDFPGSRYRSDIAKNAI